MEHTDCWYYRPRQDKDDPVKGPHSRSEMVELYKKGVIRRTAMIRYGAEGKWHPVSAYFSYPPGTKKVYDYLKFVLVVLLTTALYYVVFIYEQARTHTPVQTVSSTAAHGIAPPPKPVPPPPTQEGLTQQGIIIWTNEARIQGRLSPLIVNEQLNTIAAQRAQDMLEKQYFGHVSPAGEGVMDVARRTGYQYRVLAENIAKGPFVSDQKIVQGWLQSPGHRKNILSPDVEEIGAAIIKGALNGDTLWVGVQVFGKQSLHVPRNGTE